MHVNHSLVFTIQASVGLLVSVYSFKVTICEADAGVSLLVHERGTFTGLTDVCSKLVWIQMESWSTLVTLRSGGVVFAVLWKKGAV